MAGSLQSLHVTLSSPVWAVLISCPCFCLSVWLRGVFVHGPCLSLPTCCSLEGWPQSGSEKIDRTLRCGALCCHAQPQQVGKSEGFWLAHSGRPQGMDCLEAPHAHIKVHSTLHANEAKRSPCASGQNCAKLRKSQEERWQQLIHACAEKSSQRHGDTWMDKTIQGISNNDQTANRLLIKVKALV